MPEDFPDDGHFKWVLSSIIEGRVVPFFGAGANMCGRPGEPWHWHPDQEEFLPSGGELAEHLRDKFYLKLSEGEGDLMRVSQYADTFAGRGALYDKLYELFVKRYPPTDLHYFFARLPRLLREKGYPKNTSDDVRRRLTVVTTNYDDLLERAFEEVGQPYHVISYRSRSGAVTADEVSKFLHWPPGGGAPAPVDNAFSGFNADLRDPHPVVLKIHGAIRPLPAAEPPEHAARVPHDSFVITEDDYIDYLLEKDIMAELPKGLNTKLNTSHFLFLGYKLRDWNLRAILRRIWLGQGPQRKNSWAVMKDCTENEKKYWVQHKLTAYNTDLHPYVAKLEEHLGNWSW